LFIAFCPCILNIYGRLVQLVRCNVSTDRNGRAWPGRSFQVTDHSGHIGLARGRRTVKVITYRLFHSPAKDHVNQERTTLQYKFANFRSY